MKTAVIYSLPDCEICNQVKDSLLRQGYKLDERDLQANRYDCRVEAQYITQGRTAPVVFVDDKATNPKEIIAGSFA